MSVPSFVVAIITTVLVVNASIITEDPPLCALLDAASQCENIEISKLCTQLCTKAEDSPLCILLDAATQCHNAEIAKICTNLCKPAGTAFKNPAFVSRIEALLPDICNYRVKGMTLRPGCRQCSEEDIYSKQSQMIDLLHLIPDDAIVELLDKIRAGQYCADIRVLEGPFIGLIGFIGEPDTFKVLTRELKADRLSWRSFEGILLQTQPTLAHVKALTPIFELQNIYENIKMFVSVAINRYCSKNYGCDKRLACIKSVTQDLNEGNFDTSYIDNGRCTEGIDLAEVIGEHGGHRETAIKNKAFVQRVDAILPEICKCPHYGSFDQGQCSKQDTLSNMAQAIEFMHLVPDDAYIEILNKIRAGHYCADYTRLEREFMEFVSFDGEPGAFKLIVQEIVAGRIKPEHIPQYMIGVLLQTQPTLNHVKAFTPIFGMTNIDVHLKSAVSVVINRYCTNLTGCHNKLACIKSVTPDLKEAGRCAKGNDLKDVIYEIFP